MELNSTATYDFRPEELPRQTQWSRPANIQGVDFLIAGIAREYGRAVGRNVDLSGNIPRLRNFPQSRDRSAGSAPAHSGQRNSYRREFKKKRYHVTPSATNVLKLADWPVNFVMLASQNLRAMAFFSMTRICQLPGQWSHTLLANSVPIPRCRYRRNTKNSAMSQALPPPDGDEIRATSANPTSLPSNLARNGSRESSDQ